MSVIPHAEPQCIKTGEPTIALDIAARTRDLGSGFIVRRLLPSAALRMVGPFIFVDHMGPVQLEVGTGLDVRPHPHINLATVTYLFEGEILHRDSIDSEQVIRAGAVNWMTAGCGIVHSERSPADERKSGPRLHGMQLWVALPREHEEIAPSFQHHPASSIPDLGKPGSRLRIVAGSAYGETSPVKVLSPLFYVEAELDAGATLKLPEEYADRAAYIVTGEVAADENRHGEGNLLVFRKGKGACITATTKARVMLLGGDPLDGERHVYWNFVSSSKERIERAKDDWKQRRFPIVPGDAEEFIPLPEI